MFASKVSLYIPSTEEKSAHYVEQALAGLSAIAGGASAMDQTGAWVMRDGTLMTEPVKVVYTFVTEKALDACTAFCVRIGQEIKAALAQEAVLYTVEPMHTMELV